MVRSVGVSPERHVELLVYAKRRLRLGAMVSCYCCKSETGHSIHGHDDGGRSQRALMIATLRSVASLGKGMPHKSLSVTWKSWF